MRLATILALLLAAPLGAQEVTTFPPGAAAGGGGAPSFPLLGGNGCTAPPFSFTSDATQGLCRGLAAQWFFDSVVLQADDWETQGYGTILQMIPSAADPGGFFFSADNAALDGASVYGQHPGTGSLWSNVVLNAQEFTTGTGALSNFEIRATQAGVGSATIDVASTGSLVSTTVFLADRTTFTDPLQGADGSQGANGPTYSFSGDTDSGMWRFGSNGIFFDWNGVTVGRMNANGVTAQCAGCRFGGQLGTAAAPFFVFDDFTTGIFKASGLSRIGFSIAGTEMGSFDQLGLGINLNGSASFPSVHRSSDTNTGFFFASDVVAVTTGGSEAARFVNLPNGIQLAPVLFTNLGTPADGRLVYCSDCTKATPCAGSGNGAMAKRLNGAWDCD